MNGFGFGAGAAVAGDLVHKSEHVRIQNLERADLQYFNDSRLLSRAYDYHVSFIRTFYLHTKSYTDPTRRSDHSVTHMAKSL